MRPHAPSRRRMRRLAIALLAVVWSVGGGFHVAHADMAHHEPHLNTPIAWMQEAMGHGDTHAGHRSAPMMPFLCDEDDVTIGAPAPGGFGASAGLALLAAQAEPSPSPSFAPGMGQFNLDELGPFPEVNEDDLKTVTESILCQCGCNLTVAACELSMPCSVSPKMKYDAAVMLDEGQSTTQVLDQFVADYGEKVLAAPTKEGINLAAWILPFAALGGGLLLVAWALTGWRKQRPATAEAPAPDVDADVQARIDDEVNRGL